MQKATPRAPDIRIGISGFRYPRWRGVFYPPGLPQRRELEYAAERLNSVELNGSFYSLQRPELYQAWYAATPPGFVFSVKGGRFITHLKKLRDVETPLANFFASGVLCLNDKLGPILWQLPENVGDPARFEPFFELLPKDTLQAAALAARHDERLKGRSFTAVERQRPLRHALEVRNRESCTPALIDSMRRHGIAWVVADTAGRWPYFEDVTADFVYIRLHGDTELYTSGYSAESLARWRDRVMLWSGGSEPADAVRISGRAPRRLRSRDVYVYFDNDAKVHAPFDAIALRQLVGEDERPRGTSATPKPARRHA